MSGCVPPYDGSATRSASVGPVLSLLPGITARLVHTERLGVNVLSTDRAHGEPVVLVHGNVSSALFWQEAMLALPGRFRPLAVDLRGFGGTDPLPVDATRGLRDFADDLAATLAVLDLDSVHLVGWSMGGGIVLQHLLDHASSLRSVTLVAPLSPYGFGGTTGPAGTRTSPDGAGSGAGTVNPDFVRLLAAGDVGTEHQASPRAVFRAFYVAPGFESRHEDVYVESMLTTRTGEGNYPGDARSSDHWPGAAPGTSGVLNAMAPVHCDLSAVVQVDPKPPVLWIRGDADQIVSDASMFDLATLGRLGVVPDWPGEQTHAPQPMIAQTRAVLDEYAVRGGQYREVVLPGVGHSPPIEAVDRFVAELTAHLDGSPG
ncbi:MAG: alpha/beta fold hydrolase [Geodermatophilaceae bacterium]|nr:alpha/beta fold hydrolase [Geodermatophilaceae bacterium]